MTNKIELEAVYNPDKTGQKKKVVLGLSGGTDSLVSAYLLKIQKYDLIAVTIQNSLEDEESDARRFSCTRSGAEIEELKEFCRKLGIPLQVVKASEEFKESVLGPWMADKVSGKLANPCWNCHGMRMKLLFSVMKEMGADFMATGHYAKLFHNQGHGTIFVNTSHDEELDQSSLLAGLPKEILSRLLLPLSELTRKDVLKLADNFGIISSTNRVHFNQCLSGEVSELIEKNVPKRFIAEGEMSDLSGETSLGSHQGIHHHSYGETLEVREMGRPKKYRLSFYAPRRKIIFLAQESFFKRRTILLTNCRLSEEVSWQEPLRGFFTNASGQYECWVHLKNLNSVAIEFLEEHELLEGEMVSVVRKTGKNAKVFLTGKVRFLSLELESNEGDEGASKINYSVDF